MKLEDTVISGNYATIILRLCEPRGITIDQLLAGININPQIFTHSKATISGDQFVQLFTNAYELYDDPAFGVHYGNLLSISTHGMVGFAFMTSANLRESYKVIMRYYRLIFSLIELDLSEKNNKAIFSFNFPHVIDDEIKEKMVDGFLVGFGKVSQFLFPNSEENPLLLNHEETLIIRLVAKKQNYYEDIFRFLPNGEQESKIKVEFGCETNQFIHDSKILDEELLASDSQTNLVAREQCEQALKRFEASETFPLQVKEKLMANKECLPNLESLAQHFNMHPRALSRRLKKDEISYQEILDDVRKELALEYLADSQMLMEDIAYALNFNDSSSFYRAFKRWTGSTPSIQRKRILQEFRATQ